MDEPIPLYERVDQVNTREDLADFVGALAHEFESDPDSWENPTMDQFLSAMERWIRSMEQLYLNTDRDPVILPTWSMFADILYASTMYE